jgi:serine/threonine protein kinase
MSHDRSGPSHLDSLAALFPAFDFEGLIAQGAAGAVYKARQRSLDRDVAIRIASRDNAANPGFRNAFKTMAKAMGNLAHPGLIRVYDSGEVDGLPFVIMEFVPGKTLRHSSHGKAVDPRQAVQIAMAACQGLAHAHGKGIVHGAIQPANILLTQKCEPKIGNFGFTHQDQNHAADASAYQAPELSASSSSESPQSDVYALGVILSELLTGIPAGTPDVAGTVLPDAKLAAICQKAAHPDPAQRYADAGTLAEALGQWSTSAIPRPVPVQLKTSSYRPKAPVTSKVPVVSYPGARAGRGMMVHCAVIGFLLVAIHGVWGAYEAKQDSLASLRKMEEAKPRVIIIKAEPGKETPQAIDSSLVQLKP